jgi:hypothetical protein
MNATMASTIRTQIQSNGLASVTRSHLYDSVHKSQIMEQIDRQ